MQFKMRKDGSYVAVGKNDRFYEITKGPHGTWLLEVQHFIGSSVHKALEDCFDEAASWEQEDEE